MTLCKKFLLLLPLLNRIDSILSFCRTIIFMVLPVLVLPQIFKMDGEWPSISAGEMLSLAIWCIIPNKSGGSLLGNRASR